MFSFSFSKKGGNKGSCSAPDHPQTPEHNHSGGDTIPGNDPSRSYDDGEYYNSNAHDDASSTFDGDRSAVHKPSRSSSNGRGGGGGGGAASNSAERQSRYHDEPEVDYDDNPTSLYTLIEGKDWDKALSRLERAPYEARTWVSRREGGPRSKLRWRLLPVHATCVFRSPLSLIERLLEAYPDGSQMRDDQGMLPVHLACRNGASKGVVVTLLNAFPESLRVKDRKGRVPLSLVENSTSQNREAVIIAMRKFEKEVSKKAEKEERAQKESAEKETAASVNVQGVGAGGTGGAIEVTRATSTATADPGSSNSKSFVLRQGETEVDYEHRTVLFRLVLKKDWDGTLSRSSTHPDEASTWIVTKGFNGNLRFLPIHKACVLQPPSSAIECLVAAHPDGASSKDQDGWLPLHCACFYGASDSVVSALLVAYPKGAQSKDDDGRLPLHYSCLKSAPGEVVSALLRSFPKAAMSKDDEGRLPIHHACSKGAGSDVIEALLRASPRGAQSKDDQGRLPLHHACRKGATERVISTLLRVYPRGAQAKDDQDKLPLHYACQAGAEEGVVTSLLASYPESVDVKNGFGYTPLAEARAMGENPKMVGVVRVLEGFKDEMDRKKAASTASSSAVNNTATATRGNSGSGGSGKAGGGDTAALEKHVAQLNKRVETLESVLAGVGKLGSEMKRGVAKSQNDDESFRIAVGMFAEQLAALGKVAAKSAKKQSSSSSSEQAAAPMAPATNNTAPPTPLASSSLTPASPVRPGE